MNLKKHQDKFAHVGFGAIVAFFFFWIISFWSIRVGMNVGLYMALVAGILKEIWDYLEGKQWSILDIIATFIGGIMVIGAVQIAVIHYEGLEKASWFIQ